MQEEDIDRARRRALAGGALAAVMAPAFGAAKSGEAAEGAPMTMEAPTIKMTLQHAFDIRIDFGERYTAGELPWGGEQGYTAVGSRGGLIRGPRLNGIVLPGSGADYANVRSDGIVELNAHYMLQADDGTRIHIHNTGYTGRGYFRVTPRFRAPKGPHEWLNQTIIVGSGERRREPVDHSIFSYFIVT